MISVNVEELHMDPMLGMARCPQCYLSPLLRLEESVDFEILPAVEGWASLQRVPGQIAYVLRCPIHSHEADGESIEAAVRQWNSYVSQISAEAAQ